MNWLIKRMLKSKRSVSPVVAVVLLIGVVVVGIVAVFVLFNLLTAPTTVLQVSKVNEVDRNGDGLIDRFQIELQNTGTSPAAVSDLTVVFTQPTGKSGFTVSASVSEIGSNPVMINFETSNVYDQLPNEVDYVIEVSYAGSVIATISSGSDLIDQTVSNPANADTVISDYGDGKWATSSNDATLPTVDNAALHSGSPGIVLSTTSNGNRYFFRYTSGGQGVNYGNDNTFTSSSQTPESINIDQKKVLVFWIKLGTTDNNIDFWFVFRPFSGNTISSEFRLQIVSNGAVAQGIPGAGQQLTANVWYRFIIDLTDTNIKDDSGSFSYDPQQHGSNIGFIGLRVRDADSTNIYLDDIGAFGGLQ